MSNFVNINGNINFFYGDNGTDGLDPPTYTTMVFIHGLGFNGAVFQKLFPFGPNHNYLIVSLYRRGYAPSSWTEEEAALFIRGWEEGIPKYDKEKKTGGIMLNGWPLETVYSQAGLSALDSLTTEELGQLETYLHAIIYHDSIPITFGIPRPPLAESSPFLWSATASEKWAFFRKFVTGFYVHSNSYSYDVADLNIDKPDEDRPASLSELREEELEQMLSFEMYATHNGAAITVDLEVFRFANRRALFNVEMARYLPNVKVRIMYGPEGSGLFIFSANEMERALKDPSSAFGHEAENAWEFKIVRLERRNHFVFWDEPSWAFEQFIACLDD